MTNYGQIIHIYKKNAYISKQKSRLIDLHAKSKNLSKKILFEIVLIRIAIKKFCNDLYRSKQETLNRIK